MSLSKDLIAPCGINCGICEAYLREKNPCYGCMSEKNLRTTHYHVNCGKKTCTPRKHNQDFYFCIECDRYPCQKLTSLRERYVKNYQVDIFENMKMIKEEGMESFLLKEKKKWTCPNCGKMLSVHKPDCLFCGYQYREKTIHKKKI